MKSEYDNTDVGRVPVAQPGTQQHQVTSALQYVLHLIYHTQANFPPFGATTKLWLQILIGCCRIAVRIDLLCYELITIYYF